MMDIPLRVRSHSARRSFDLPSRLLEKSDRTTRGSGAGSPARQSCSSHTCALGRMRRRTQALGVDSSRNPHLHPTARTPVPPEPARPGSLHPLEGKYLRARSVRWQLASSAPSRPIVSGSSSGSTGSLACADDHSRLNRTRLSQIKSTSTHRRLSPSKKPKRTLPDRGSSWAKSPERPRSGLPPPIRRKPTLEDNPLGQGSCESSQDPGESAAS